MVAPDGRASSRQEICSFLGKLWGAADWVGGVFGFFVFYFFGRYGDGEPVYSIVSRCMALVAAM